MRCTSPLKMGATMEETLLGLILSGTIAVGQVLPWLTATSQNLLPEDIAAALDGAYDAANSKTGQTTCSHTDFQKLVLGLIRSAVSSACFR